MLIYKDTPINYHNVYKGWTDCYFDKIMYT